MGTRLFRLALAIAALAGCTNAPTPVGGTDASDIGDVSVTEAADIDAATAPPDSGWLYIDTPDVPIPPGAMHTIVESIGPIHLDIAEETTQCMLVRLGNVSPQFLLAIQAHLGLGSHHLIFYRAMETVEQPTPFACLGFSGVTDATHFDSPMIIAQTTDASLSMPPGVGMHMDANQMVRIEMHGINLTGAPVDMVGTVTLTTVDETVPLIPADVMFWGNLNINIPPHTTAQVDFFHEPWRGVNVFGLTSHTHEHGAVAPMGNTIYVASDMSTDPTMAVDERLVHQSLDWQHPPLTLFDPPLTFGQYEGMHLTCRYDNTTDTAVGFGESFFDEMCFMWAYYYPAVHGAQVCAMGFNGNDAPDAAAVCLPP